MFLNSYHGRRPSNLSCSFFLTGFVVGFGVVFTTILRFGPITIHVITVFVIIYTDIVLNTIVIFECILQIIVASSIFCETTLPLFFLELIFHRTFIFKFALRVCSFFIALLCFKPMTLHILYVCLVGIGLGA